VTIDDAKMPRHPFQVWRRRSLSSATTTVLARQQGFSKATQLVEVALVDILELCESDFSKDLAGEESAESDVQEPYDILRKRLLERLGR
jgi:hypothetical protein